MKLNIRCDNNISCEIILISLFMIVANKMHKKCYVFMSVYDPLIAIRGLHSLWFGALFHSPCWKKIVSIIVHRNWGSQAEGRGSNKYSDIFCAVRIHLLQAIRLTIHLHPVPMTKENGTLPPLPHTSLRVLRTTLPYLQFKTMY